MCLPNNARHPSIHLSAADHVTKIHHDNQTPWFKVGKKKTILAIIL